jgi:uncharacterized protein
MSLWFKIILAPLISMIIVQSIKLATDGIKGNFTIRDLLTAYGGMPSSHTAVVVSLSTMVAYRAGIESAAFAIAVVFSVIVISDAMTLRRVIDGNSKSIHKLITNLPQSQQQGYPVLPRNIEHTFPQVLVGGLIGFIIAFIINLL